MKKPKSCKPRGLNRDKIRKMYESGYCISAIARKYDCHLNAIMWPEKRVKKQTTEWITDKIV